MKKVVIVIAIGVIATGIYFFQGPHKSPKTSNQSSTSKLSNAKLSTTRVHAKNEKPVAINKVSPRISQIVPLEATPEILNLIFDEQQFTADMNKIIDEFSIDDLSEESLNEFTDRLWNQEADAIFTLVKINSRCLKMNYSTSSCARVPQIELENENDFINYPPFQALEDLAKNGNINAQLRYWEALRTLQADGLLNTAAYPHEWQWRRDQAFNWLNRFSKQGSYYASAELASAFFLRKPCSRKSVPGSPVRNSSKSRKPRKHSL
ncbi:MAG: hypothetical protein OIF38_17525 [Cellvibrionaceae bacterium]|nr:hypothetical protein [Cellvibrionaceae bacterium]